MNRLAFLIAFIAIVLLAAHSLMIVTTGNIKDYQTKRDNWCYYTGYECKEE